MYKIVYCAKDMPEHLILAENELNRLFPGHRIICVNDNEEMTYTDDIENEASIFDAIYKIYNKLLAF